jgi:alpha-L-rhamnosidase
MNSSAEVADPRVRRYVLPARIVWTQGGVEGAERLLTRSDPPCVLRGPASLLVDFGRELHGGARFEVPHTGSGKPVRARVRFGESVSEAMGSPNQDHTIHDFETLLPWMGHQEIGNTGFRFVRLDLLEEGVEVQLQAVCAVFLYRDLEWKGAFECSDPALNAVWRTGAYTVQLCMQDYLWDGVKRDRLVWIGDMHPETVVAATVFGECDVVPSSLDYVRDRTPLPEWMNGISSYSIWWLMCQRDWYRFHGSLAYLREQRDYLLGLLDLLQRSVGEDGREALTGTRFLEWPTARDATAIDAGLQALMVLGLRAGADLCRVLGEEDAALRAEAVAERATACRRAPTASKQASALLVLAEMSDAYEINRAVLSVNPFRFLSTFYGYYVLQARAAAGDYAGAIDLIRTYWGGMLEMGATTFWEHFEIDWMPGAVGITDLPVEGKKDIHADFGDHCFVGLRHSLCHGWAAGPTAWLTEHVLGLAPRDGGRVVTVRPHLAGLEWARGTLPTPLGPVTVEHRRVGDEVRSDIRAPQGVQVIR